MSVEQLYYGWASRGREGRDREQLIAGSSGCRDRTRSLETHILPLLKNGRGNATGCAYLTPLSLTVVFRRTDTGKDAFGRDGAFFTHAILVPGGVVGPALASLYERFPWRDSPPSEPDDTLPTLDGLPTPASDLEPHDESAAVELVAQALEDLTLGRTAVVRGIGGSVAWRALCTLSDALSRQAAPPSFVVGRPPPGARFDIACVPEERPNGPVSADSLLAAEIILDNSPTTAALKRALIDRYGQAGGLLPVVAAWAQSERIIAAREEDPQAAIAALESREREFLISEPSALRRLASGSAPRTALLLAATSTDLAPTEVMDDGTELPPEATTASVLSRLGALHPIDDETARWIARWLEPRWSRSVDVSDDTVARLAAIAASVPDGQQLARRLLDDRPNSRPRFETLTGRSWRDAERQEWATELDAFLHNILAIREDRRPLPAPPPRLWELSARLEEHGWRQILSTDTERLDAAVRAAESLDAGDRRRAALELVYDRHIDDFGAAGAPTAERWLRQVERMSPQQLEAEVVPAVLRAARRSPRRAPSGAARLALTAVGAAIEQGARPPAPAPDLAERLSYADDEALRRLSREGRRPHAARQWLEESLYCSPRRTAPPPAAPDDGLAPDAQPTRLPDAASSSDGRTSPEGWAGRDESRGEAPTTKAVTPTAPAGRLGSRLGRRGLARGLGGLAALMAAVVGVLLVTPGDDGAPGTPGPEAVDTRGSEPSAEVSSQPPGAVSERELLLQARRLADRGDYRRTLEVARRLTPRHEAEIRARLSRRLAMEALAALEAADLERARRHVARALRSARTREALSAEAAVREREGQAFEAGGTDGSQAATSPETMGPQQQPAPQASTTP